MREHGRLQEPAAGGRERNQGRAGINGIYGFGDERLLCLQHARHHDGGGRGRYANAHGKLHQGHRFADVIKNHQECEFPFCQSGIAPKCAVDFFTNHIGRADEVKHELNARNVIFRSIKGAVAPAKIVASRH